MLNTSFFAIFFSTLLISGQVWATEFSWDIVLNNYTGATVSANWKRFEPDTEFKPVKSITVKPGDGDLQTLLRFSTGGKGHCALTIATRGTKDDARLLSIKATPKETCRVDYTPGPYSSTANKIAVSILPKRGKKEPGFDLASLYCTPEDISTLAPNIESSHFKGASGRTKHYRVVLKNGSKRDYEVLDRNSWERCMKTNSGWFTARDPEGFFESTLPPDWRLRGGLKGPRRLHFEKPGTEDRTTDAQLTVLLLPANTTTGDDPATLDDGVYVLMTTKGMLTMTYRAPKDVFAANIGAFYLFIEGLKLSTTER